VSTSCRSIYTEHHPEKLWRQCEFQNYRSDLKNMAKLCFIYRNCNHSNKITLSDVNNLTHLCYIFIIYKNFNHSNTITLLVFYIVNAFIVSIKWEDEIETVLLVYRANKMLVWILKCDQKVICILLGDGKIDMNITCDQKVGMNITGWLKSWYAN
jgi:hypothetical protein